MELVKNTIAAMQVNDRVRLKHRPDVTGTITKVDPHHAGDIYTVQYDDNNLIPPYDDHVDSDLELIDPNDITYDPFWMGMPNDFIDDYYDFYGEDMADSNPTPLSIPKCECGARHTSFPNIHADYCPLNKTVVKLKKKGE